MGKLDPKSNCGSFKESHPEEKQKSGNPFVKPKDHGSGSGAEEKYLQVAETSFSQAVNNLQEFFQELRMNFIICEKYFRPVVQPENLGVEAVELAFENIINKLRT